MVGLESVPGARTSQRRGRSELGSMIMPRTGRAHSRFFGVVPAVACFFVVDDNNDGHHYCQQSVLGVAFGGVFVVVIGRKTFNGYKKPAETQACSLRRVLYCGRSSLLVVSPGQRYRRTQNVLLPQHRRKQSCTPYDMCPFLNT